MTPCDELAPLIAARSLGVLEPEEEARVAEHLALCPGCPKAAEKFAAALEQAVPDERKAPEAAWEKLRSRIERDQSESVREELRVLLSCSYCHASLAKPEAVYCASCLAPHHGDCFSEHGRCSAPGCGETQVVSPRSLAPTPRRAIRPWVVVAAIGCGTIAAWTSKELGRWLEKPVEDMQPPLSEVTPPLGHPPSSPPKPEEGEVKDGTYRSKTSGFEVAVPSGWQLERNPNLSSAAHIRVTMHRFPPGSWQRSVPILVVGVKVYPEVQDMEGLIQRTQASKATDRFSTELRSSWNEDRCALDIEALGREQEVDLHYRFFFVMDVKQHRVVGLACAATPDTWSLYAETFENVCRSLHVEGVEEKPVPKTSELTRAILDAPVDSGFGLHALEGTVVAVGRDGEVYELDAGGKRLPWRNGRVAEIFRGKTVSDGAVGVFGDVFSTPEVLGEKAYVGTTGGILALDLAGRQLETFYRRERGAVVARPLVLPRAGRIVAATTAGEILAFAPGSSDPVWVFATEGPILQPGVAIDDAERFVGFVAADERLHILDADSGKPVVEPIFVGPLVGAPVRRGERSFFATETELVTIRTAGGNPGQWWRERWACGKPFAFAVSADGKTVVTADDVGLVRALDPITLEQRWVVHADSGEIARKPPQVALLAENKAHPEQVLVLWPSGRSVVEGLDGKEPFGRELVPGVLSVAGDRIVVSDSGGSVHFFERPF